MVFSFPAVRIHLDSHDCWYKGSIYQFSAQSTSTWALLAHSDPCTGSVSLQSMPTGGRSSWKVIRLATCLPYRIPPKTRLSRWLKFRLVLHEFAIKIEGAVHKCQANCWGVLTATPSSCQDTMASGYKWLLYSFSYSQFIYYGAFTNTCFKEYLLASIKQCYSVKLFSILSYYYFFFFL